MEAKDLFEEERGKLEGPVGGERKKIHGLLSAGGRS